MNAKFFLMAVLALLMSCKKDSQVQPIAKSVMQLLTQKEWMLKAVGFDDNKNDILDSNENVITDCQKDNSYLFHIDGSGKVLDNALSCGTPVNDNFTWNLIDDGKGLEIEAAPIKIANLTENELILIPDLPGLAVNYILIYSH